MNSKTALSLCAFACFCGAAGLPAASVALPPTITPNTRPDITVPKVTDKIPPLLLGHLPKTNSGVALGWLGCVDTDVSFADWFSGDFTLTARFLPEYGNVYAGPILAENGGGTFFIGMADCGDGERMILRVGSKEAVFDAPVQTGKWNQVAVTRQKYGFTLSLNGSKLGSIGWNGIGGPTGTLRIGRRTNGQLVQGHDAQFFGLVDDIGIYKTVLSEQELKTGEAATGASSKIGQRIGGFEANLWRGVVFDFPALGENKEMPAALRTNLTYSKAGASLAFLSPNRDASKDGDWILLPKTAQPMLLPIPPNEAWMVIQSNASPKGDSHRGYAAFCWDLIRANEKTGQGNQPGTKNAPVRAAGSGRIVFVRESTPNSTLNAGASNCVMIRHNDREYAGYLHIRQNSYAGKKPDGKLPQDVPLDKAPPVFATAPLGETGDTGAGVGAYHIHFALTDQVDDGNHAIVTIPAAFTNYLASDDNGKTWVSVAAGVPKRGQWIKTLK